MADILFSQIPGENLRAGTDIVHTSGRDVIGVAAARYVNDSVATPALAAAHPRFVARSGNGRYWRALPEADRIAVEVGGAKADGTTDDGPAVRAATLYAAAIGARGVRFGAASYRVEAIPPSEMAVAGNPPIQLIPPVSAIHDYGNAVLTRQGPGRGLLFHPENAGPIVNLPLAADVAAGSREVQLIAGGGAQLAVGDWVLWQFGEFPYDVPETPSWDIARIDAVTGNLIRLDRPVPEAVTLSAITGPNKRLRKLAILRDCTIRDLTLSGPAIEDGIAIYCAQRIRIERVGARNIGAGTVVAQYCDGLTIEDCWQDGSLLTQASFGPAFNFAETRNCLLVRPRATAALCLVSAEAGAEVSVVAGKFENTRTDPQGQALGSQVVVINAVGRASVTVHDLTVSGHGGYRLAETSNGVLGYDGAVLFTGTTRLRHPSAPYSIPLGAMTGTLDLNLGGIRETYNFERLRNWKRRFALKDGEYTYAFGPAGLLVRARAYTSPGVTVGTGQQLTGLWVGRTSNNGSNVADGVTRELDPGKDVALPCFAGLVGGAQWTYRNDPLALLCTTAANAGLNAANEFVEFEGWFAEQPDLDVPLSEAAYRSGGIERDPFEALFPGYDLPALAAGATMTIDLQIPDMASGDFIDAVRLSGGFAGLELRAVEARSGLARLTIVNPSATLIDRTAADLAVSFFRSTTGA